MALFFDAVWFDERLAACGLDRAALAVALGLDRAELHRLFTNERAPMAGELETITRVLGADLMEVTLRSGIATREASSGGDPADRIESIEARLDAIDKWLEEFEAAKKRA